MLLLVFIPSGVASGSDLLFAPAITVGEEYDDNISLDPTERDFDYITHIMPALSAEYSSPLWKWKFAYSYDGRYFARNTYANDDIHKLSLTSTVDVISNLLYLDLRDDADRTSLSIVRDYTSESPVKYQTQYNVFEVIPYAVLQLTTRMTLTTGYQYRNIWYDDPLAIDRTISSAYVELSRKTTDRFSLTVSGRNERLKTTTDTRKHTAFLGGGRYEYRESSYLWGSIGLSRSTDERGSGNTLTVWDAGIAYQMNTILLRVETGKRWVDDPTFIQQWEDSYSASLRYTQERTSGGVRLAVKDYGPGSYLSERKYTSAIEFSHYLTRQTEANYSLTVDRYDRYPASAPNTMTIVYLTNVRLDHHATDKLTLSFDYRYMDSYSGQVYPDNYEVNRIMVELKKSF
jgi:hypothetical protein